MKGIFMTTFVASVIMTQHLASADMDPSADCHSLIDHALCENDFAVTEKWAWDPNKKTCDIFMRGECEGNTNAYASQEECLKVCDPGKHVRKTRRSSSQLVNTIKELNQNLALRNFPKATDNEENDKLQKANERKVLAPAWLWRTVQKTRPDKDGLAFKRNSLKREGENVLSMKGLSRISNLFKDTSVKEHKNARHRPMHQYVLLRLADSYDNRLDHSDRINQNDCSSTSCWLHKSLKKSRIKASQSSKKATSSKDSVASDIYHLNLADARHRHYADRLTDVDHLNPINCFAISCWLKKYRAKKVPSVYPTSLLSKSDFSYNRATRLNEVDGLDNADRINYADRIHYADGLRYFIPSKNTERSKQYRLHRFVQTESRTRSPLSLYNLIQSIKLFNSYKLKQFDRTPNKKIIKLYLDNIPIVRNPYQLDEIVDKATVEIAGPLFSDENERMDKPNEIAIPHKRGFKSPNFIVFLDRKYKPNTNFTHLSPYFLMDDAFNMMVRIDNKNSSLPSNPDADSATNTNSNKQQKREKKFKTVIYHQLR